MTSVALFCLEVSDSASDEICITTIPRHIIAVVFASPETMA